ncbi:hypothetical protein OVY01_18485 [Robbsia sp. Bb-Pol-6]|uniref:Uncharacterized protein n=1 Tax=Robbsia betulipollinis TaxID=2981849 RepID=A0ABT3ZRU1_9BURK|nr:hypothetical protein [Robbsia betulipollinis]MCY0389137.1 hypothetical protein [Robbsia betulipollinis]
MLLKDVRNMSAEDAKTARVTAFRLSATCDWLLYVNGEAVVNANSKLPRAFLSLSPIIAALDEAGIDGLKVDIHIGKHGKFVSPDFQSCEAAIRTCLAINQARAAS